MSNGARRSLPSSRSIWVATGFWLFVAAISAVQTLWISQTPGQRVDARETMTWQAAYFVAWIPFTVAVWHLTRGWLPERFGGWPRLLLAHVPVAAAVTIPHTFVVALLSQALANQNMSLWDTFARQLRGQMNAGLLIYTAIAGTGAAMALYEQSQDRQLAAARLQAELAAAQLKALSAHLQPHFLFNSLHSVAALARAGDTAGVV